MNLKEKFIAIFMSALLAFMIFPFSAFAEEPVQEQEKSETQTTESLENDQDAESDAQLSDVPTEGVEPETNLDSSNDASDDEKYTQDESAFSLSDGEESDEVSDSVEVIVPETSTPQASDKKSVNSRSARAAKSGVSGTCEWAISSNGTLVLSAANGAAAGKIEFPVNKNNRAIAPWASHKTEITSVRCEDPISVVRPQADSGESGSGTEVDGDEPPLVKPVSLSGLFAGCTNLKTVDFTNFDLSDAGDFS